MLGEYGVVIFKPAVFEWSSFYVGFVEFFFTWTFLVVVFHNKSLKVSLISDLVLGVIASMISLYFSIKCSALYTGACLSPTVAFVNHTFVAFYYNDTSLLQFMPAYIIGPMLAGVLAAVFTKHVSCKFYP